MKKGIRKRFFPQILLMGDLILLDEINYIFQEEELNGDKRHGINEFTYLKNNLRFIHLISPI